MTTQPRKILVTCALPYANGAIHLGHMLEHIQADIWVRFQRMRGNNIHFVCADDAHGTPIMLNANKLGITPEELIAKAKADEQVAINNSNKALEQAKYLENAKEIEQLRASLASASDSEKAVAIIFL